MNRSKNSTNVVCGNQLERILLNSFVSGCVISTEAATPVACCPNAWTRSGLKARIRFLNRNATWIRLAPPRFSSFLSEKRKWIGMSDDVKLDGPFGLVDPVTQIQTSCSVESPSARIFSWYAFPNGNKVSTTNRIRRLKIAARETGVNEDEVQSRRLGSGDSFGRIG